ncbi:MAG: hypothetical protein WCG27_12075, partial [Pseudomonadota bacterium]
MAKILLFFILLYSWQAGASNLNFIIEQTGIQTVITAQKLSQELLKKKESLGKMAPLLITIEELKAQQNFKLQAALAQLRSKLSWGELDQALSQVPEESAIVYTSGPEKIPFTGRFSLWRLPRSQR